MCRLTQTTHPRAALTLLEVVVCLAVAFILGALLFPSMNSRPPGPRLKVSSVVRSVVNATQNYIEDYGHPPRIPAALVSSAGTESFYSFGDTVAGGCRLPNNQLFDVLRAIDRGANAGHALNPRKQKYFEDRRATGREEPHSGFADGAEFPAHLQGQLLDPWGKQYCIIIEAENGAGINLKPFFQDLTKDIRRSVVVFSMGKNQQIGGKGYPGRLRRERSNEAPEDIASWQ